METEPLPPLEHLPPRFDDNPENVQGMCIHPTPYAPLNNLLNLIFNVIYKLYKLLTIDCWQIGDY